MGGRGNRSPRDVTDAILGDYIASRTSIDPPPQTALNVPHRDESFPDPSRRRALERGTLDVLVADDDPTVRQMLGRVLRRRGHHVHEARDADEAVRLARSVSLHVALVDDQMPGGGRRVIAALAADGFTGVVAFMGGALGADGRPMPEGVHVLTKPFDLDRLIKVVEGEPA